MTVNPHGRRLNTDASVHTPVFDGTCVPIQALVDHLEAGRTLDEFFREYPFLNDEQVSDALDQMQYDGTDGAIFAATTRRISRTLERVKSGNRSDPKQSFLCLCWIAGALVAPPAVAAVYLFWVDWTSYPYRGVTDYAALAVGIGAGVSFIYLLPIHWLPRLLLSFVYTSAILYVVYSLYMFAQSWS